jgi:hypothetical protein
MTQSQRIPRVVVHYGKYDPTFKVGGVETFARNLKLVFEEVLFMTPASKDFEKVAKLQLPIICDNHWVLDLPNGLPAIAFQHGVAALKLKHTRRFSDFRVARRQRKAARRPKTVWVACARWIAEHFSKLHANRAQHVIYHQVDLHRFDGRVENAGSRLVLHDARSDNKGKRLIECLAGWLPKWRFEPLNCKPSEVPDRMRRACAFMHLSKYEGNSIVCNEAMAQNLPCFFTKVGLFKDTDGPTDVELIDAEVAYTDEHALVDAARRFLDQLGEHHYQPRQWVQQHASHEAVTQAWRKVLLDFDNT